MIAARLALSFLLAAALLTGCDDKKTDNPKPDNAKPDTAKTEGAKTPSAEDAKKAAEAAKAASDASAKTAAEAAAKAKTDATDWMAKLEDAIKAKKLDEAKSYLDKLDGIKASLPADMQSKLTALKTTYDTAKTGAAIPGGVPAIPGLPNK